MAGQPPGDGPLPPPRHAAPTGHAGRGDSVGPPHPHTRAHSTWVADPNSPPSGRAVGGGTAPGLRRPPQWWKASPPGTPSRHPHSEQRKGARCGAGAGSPHPHRPHPGHTRRGTLAARSRGRAVGGGTAPDLRRSSPWWKVPPLGDALPPPSQRATPARRGTRWGPVLGPHARTDRTRDTWVTEPWLPAPEDGRPGEGQRLTPDAPRNAGKRPLWGRPSATPTTSNAPPHQLTSHGTTAPHPLLLGTATQQWRNPRPHAKHAPDL